ncbi:MAG: glycosyltransferase family 4 protein [Polyangiaceae bacterium]|nr:glycosyltransferase family 4 protein [Polyangiaceae bacterium]
MNILYHHRTQGTGAEGVHVAYVIKGLRGQGHSVEVVSPNEQEPGDTAGSNPFGKPSGLKRRVLRRVSRAAPQWAFECLELGYNLPALFRLGGKLRRRPSFLYERHAFFLGAGAFLAKKTRTPYMVEVNEVAGEARVRDQILVGPAQKIEAYVFRQADAIIVVSEFLKERITNLGVPAAKIHVVPNGVDETLFDPTRERVDVRGRLGIAPSTVVVGFVGWFVPWHNLELLLNAFADVARGQDARLCLVGDGALKEALLEQAVQLGIDQQLVFPGAVPYSQMPDFVAAMDICVIPGSNAYRSPIKLFEYMAMGKPVVAPFYPPIRSVLEPESEGLIFAPDDRQELAAHLDRLLKDPELRRRMGQKGREKVLAKHLWRHVAERVLNIYQGISK